MISSALLAKAYEDNVLNKAHHSRLVQDLERIALRAHVPVHMVCTRLATYCTDIEVQYVTALSRHAEQGKYGLIYTGNSSLSLSSRMQAIAGACLRNYVDARVDTLGDILTDYPKGQYEQPTVLLIPNFFVVKSKVADWHVSSLLDLLLERSASGLQSFLYVQNLDGLKNDYGTTLYNHLINHFVQLTS